MNNPRRSHPTSRPDLTQRAFGLAVEQDADNDNDDTTLFQRPSEWVSQLSSVVGDATPEKWEELDRPFKRSAAPLPRRQSVPPPLAPRQRLASGEQPTAAEPRDSLEPVEAIEGSLQRSLRPRRNRRRQLLALSVPLTAALALLAGSNTPRAEWPYWHLPLPGQAKTPLASTRGLLMPAPAAAQPVAAAVVEQAPVVEAAPVIEQPVIEEQQPREHRVAKAQSKSRGKHEKRGHRIEFSRNITPLRESAVEDAPPLQPVGQGILQINSRPWAKVVIDGAFMGHTPQRALRLSAGWHRVRLINEPLGMSKSLDIQIMANETARYVETLDEGKQ